MRIKSSIEEWVKSILSKLLGMPSKSEDKEAAKNWVVTMFQSMEDGDFDTFCSLVTEDVKLYPPNMNPLIGIEAMKKLTKPWFDTYNMSHEITEITAEIDSNTAYAFAQYTDTIKLKNGGDTIVTPNKAIYILKRESNGLWKATSIIWNRNPPEE